MSTALTLFLSLSATLFLSIMGFDLSLPKNEEIQFLGATYSPLCYRIECALKLKGLEYEYIEEDLWNKSELLLKSNPVHKQIPVLLHNGKVIAESRVILEYIEETWKENPLLPEDPYERAMARFWSKYFDDMCTTYCGIAFLGKGEYQEKAIELLLQSLKVVEGELKGKKFFGGDCVGFLDLVVSWVPRWLPIIEEIRGFKVLNSQDLPYLSAWCETFEEVPTIKEHLPSYNQIFPYAMRKFHEKCG